MSDILFIKQRLLPRLGRSFKHRTAGDHPRLSHPRTLAVWRESPETVMIQIRRDIDFMCAHVNLAECLELREALDGFIGELKYFAARKGGA